MNELRDYRRFMKKEEMHKSLNLLIGILSGISADGIVNEAESNEIKNWYSIHSYLLNVYPFSEILPSIKLAFQDDVFDIEEANGILWLCKKFTDSHQEDLYFDLLTSQIQLLEGKLHGIVSDGIITDNELCELSNWLDENEHLAGTYPFDEVYSLLLAANEDGEISDDERNMLKAFFATFVNTNESYNIHKDDVDELQKRYCIGGICAVCPEIEFKNKTFLLYWCF